VIGVKYDDEMRIMVVNKVAYEAEVVMEYGTQTDGFMNRRWIPHALLVCRIAHFVILASGIRNESIALHSCCMIILGNVIHFLNRHTV